jgi:hypothetical protein
MTSKCIKDQTKRWVRQLLAADSVQDQPGRGNGREEDGKTFKQIKEKVSKGAGVRGSWRRQAAIQKCHTCALAYTRRCRTLQQALE